MTYRVTRAAVNGRIAAKENFMCGGLTGDSIGAAYHVRSYGVLIGLVTADGTAYVNTTRYTPTTGQHASICRTVWPTAKGASQAQMHAAAAK